MRVFCPQHKIGFFTPRRNPIRCENRGHVLGEFIFDSDAKPPTDTVWQYCCNCEHFCPIESEQGALEACPACGREISQLYLCDRCFTFSFESSTPSQAKNFTLTSEGAPQPSCPGCFQEASGDLREHDCDELGARFTAALGSCPICLEQLDVGPVFPSPVAQYLKKTKAANKLNVAFDYEAALFLPSDDGQFVLVRNGTQDSRPFVLPRTLRFKSKRDFYELYQDYYHCSNVTGGEVHIIEPAFVQRVGDGWKLQSMGVLEVIDAQPETDALANSPRETEFQSRQRPALFSATLTEDSTAVRQDRPTVIDKSPEVSCINCGSLLDNKYAFCWNCGHSTQPNAGPSKESKKTTALSHHLLANDDEPTLQQDIVEGQPAMFSWAHSESPPATPTRSSRLNLIAILVIGLFSIMLALFLLKGPISQLGRSADAQQVSSSLQSAAGVPPRTEPTADRTRDPKLQTNPAIDSAEEELRKLREKRIGASPSDRLTIIQLFASKEEQFADDYRFPYERAKVVINTLETRSHHDAFNALSVAAGKAIKAGKADEMLKWLETDSTTDFHKLSHGHREWTQIIEALKSKDLMLVKRFGGALAAN